MKKLNNGCTLPAIGLGTSGKTTGEFIYNSIKDGVRLIDTASSYKNEEEVGKGIKKALDEGIIKREELFVITKIMDIEEDDPEQALKNSLKRLQLEYVDLYLDHWPSFKSKNNSKLIPITKTWNNFEKLVEKGLTKYIGVSNYNVQGLLVLLSICKIKPSFNEVEFHPYLYQKNLKDFCDKENIALISYNPITKGTYCKDSEKIIKEKNLDLFNEKVVLDLAKKYNKTPGQIILNWNIHLGNIPIPSTTNPNRIKENLASADFKMDEEDFKKLCSFQDKQYRFCNLIIWGGPDVFA